MDGQNIILTIQIKEQEFIIDVRKLGVVVLNAVLLSLSFIMLEGDKVTVCKTEADLGHTEGEIRGIDEDIKNVSKNYTTMA